MFKDLYKKANDRVPTEDAYLRVMEKVNAEQKTIKYPYGKIAALAACFILTVSLISVYEKAAPDTKEPLATILAENLPTPNVTPDGNEGTENAGKTVEQGIAVVSVTPDQTAEPVATEEPAVTETEPVAESVYTKNQGIPENIGLGVAKFTLGEPVTEEQYFDYLGKNVTENVVLPEGFTNQSSKEHVLTLTEGEEFNDRWTFYFADDNGSIFITTTKVPQNVQNILGNEKYIKSNILGCDAVIFEEELEKIACFISGGIGYTVSSYDVSDEDFEKLLTSLIK